MSRRVLTSLTLIAAFTGMVGVGYTFVPARGRWPGATAEFRISTQSFPQGSLQEQVVRGSFEDWNRVDGCEFLFTYGPSANSSATNHGDRINGIGFSSQIQQSVLGVAFSNDRGRTRFASDVLFNSRLNWSFDGSPSRREFEFKNTSDHELGHALGLNHSDRGCRALMGGGCGSAGVIRRMTSDDIAGAQFLYPGASRHTSGGGSAAAPQVDWRLVQVQVSPQQARPGERVTVQYVVQNAGGATRGNAPERLYLLSTNQTISTQDTLLVTAPERQGPFDSGDSFQGQSEIVVPSGTTPGTYFLGLLIDPRDADTEADEGNNTAFAALEVLSSAPAPAPSPAPQSTPATSPAPQPTPAASPAPRAAGQVDWQISQLTATPQQVREGDTLSLSYTLTNGGAVDASALPDVVVVLSTNDTITTNDTVIETVPGQAVAVAPGFGDSQTFSFQVGQLPAGSYFVGVIADPSDAMVEALEDNNTAAAPLEVLGATASPAPASSPSPAASPDPTASPSPTSSPSPASSQTAAAATAQANAVPAAGGGGGGGGGCSLAPGQPTEAPMGLALLVLLLGLGRARRQAARAA